MLRRKGVDGSLGIAVDVSKVTFFDRDCQSFTDSTSTHSRLGRSFNGVWSAMSNDYSIQLEAHYRQGIELVWLVGLLMTGVVLQSQMLGFVDVR